MSEPFPPIVGPVPFNSTDAEPTGGDALTANLNQYYNQGDTGFIIICAALVLLMVPGLGFFYAGLARRKSALSLILVTVMSYCVVSVQWYFWGYSLAFTSTGTNSFIGNLDKIGLNNVLAANSPGSPYVSDLLFAQFQAQFAAVTVAIILGAVAERSRIFPTIVFTFIWTTIVYCPMAYWVWNPSGWAFKLGVLDFAGGGPVEIASGFGGLAYSIALGPREGDGRFKTHRPHSISNVVLGTVFLWFGWFGFNAGSALGANLRAVMAFIVTNLSGCAGAIVWILMDYRMERKWSVVGLCSGAISGLVAATPSSGFINPHAGIACGVVSAVICNFATKIKYLIHVDDSMDIFAVHGIAGVVGLLINAFFGVNYIPALDGILLGDAAISGGWFNHHWIQLGYQLAYICATSAYAFVVTMLILLVINLIPGLSLRVDHVAELKGVDETELGEFAYDFVEVRRDYDSFQHRPGVTEGMVADLKQNHQSEEFYQSSPASAHKKGEE